MNTSFQKEYISKFQLWSFAVLLLLSYACQTPTEEFSESPSIRLSFSADSVNFDTVFTTRGSITKRVRVFNTSDNAIRLNRISLGTPSNSPYSLIVNGLESNQITDLRLLGKDSMYVLVKVLIDPVNQDLPFVIRDSILFSFNGVTQDIKLSAWGQDANYFGKTHLPCNTVWNSAKPYVVTDTLFVDENCQFTLDSGVHVFLEKEAAIYVDGSLTINGSLEKKVMMNSVRRDDRYKTTPGQWRGVYLSEKSKSNRISYLEMRNGTIGFDVRATDSTIVTNSIIENFASVGIRAEKALIRAENIVVNSCIDYVVALYGGGYYFNHNTLANYSTPVSFSRDSPLLYLSDQIVNDEGPASTSPINTRFVNTIIYGSRNEEIAIQGVNMNGAFNSQNCLIRSRDTGLETNGNILNKNPRFVSVSKQNFQLDSLSPAVDKGTPTSLSNDIIGTPRGTTPDIGAYEFSPMK